MSWSRQGRKIKLFWAEDLARNRNLVYYVATIMFHAVINSTICESLYDKMALQMRMPLYSQFCGVAWQVPEFVYYEGYCHYVAVAYAFQNFEDI